MVRTGKTKKRSLSERLSAVLRTLFGGGRKASARPGRRIRITFTGDEGRKYRRIAIIVGAVALGAVIIASLRREPSLYSSAEVGIVRDRGVFAVGVRDNVPGMYENGAGLEAELALLLAERLLPDITDGNAVHFVSVSEMTVSPYLDDGTVNAAAAMLEAGGSAKYVYSEPYYTDRIHLAFREGESDRAIEGLKIGCIQSNKLLTSPVLTALDAYIANNPESALERVALASYPDLFDALSAGRIDAVAITDVMARKYYGTRAFSLSQSSVGSISYAFACPADSPAYAEIASIMIREMKEDGSLASLIKKYALDGAILSSGADG